MYFSRRHTGPTTFVFHPVTSKGTQSIIACVADYAGGNVSHGHHFAHVIASHHLSVTSIDFHIGHCERILCIVG
jgi:hypothetical protein